MNPAICIIVLVTPVVIFPLIIGHVISRRAEKISDRHWDDYEAFHDRVNCSFQDVGLPPLSVPRDRQDVFIWRMGRRGHTAEFQAFRAKVMVALAKSDQQNRKVD